MAASSIHSLDAHRTRTYQHKHAVRGVSDLLFSGPANHGGDTTITNAVAELAAIEHDLKTFGVTSTTLEALAALRNRVACAEKLLKQAA